MKIMQLCLVILALLKVSAIAASEISAMSSMIYDEVYDTFCDSGTYCHKLVKTSPVFGGAIGGVITGSMLCIADYTAGTYSVPTYIAFLLGGGCTGVALGLGVAYTGIKIYRSCVLHLQRRQNSDSDYQLMV
jgi:hypothetical protein